eukprot:TRINITY_DN39694_c0_g1_i1.p1 TRINITY_DN39694_c0_g1~~TRINITY_DN39694_c0_g1_i1.p1  ORF type:complete len:281 (-),score=54.99 TRINITY_DN39694_c0_g1_i1:82-879(-)
MELRDSYTAYAAEDTDTPWCTGCTEAANARDDDDVDVAAAASRDAARAPVRRSRAASWALAPAAESAEGCADVRAAAADSMEERGASTYLAEPSIACASVGFAALGDCPWLLPAAGSSRAGGTKRSSSGSRLPRGQTTVVSTCPSSAEAKALSPQDAEMSCELPRRCAEQSRWVASGRDVREYVWTQALGSSGASESSSTAGAPASPRGFALPQSSRRSSRAWAAGASADPLLCKRESAAPCTKRARLAEPSWSLAAPVPWIAVA